ncbi:hypothetical protein Bhyg_07150 [Pseudolycoriella hygida]|uniref:Uncharacterized protein n=1 Tax=Pseudolycoriella hygida TaxID=35572 RepID=A0A9Q0N218_9DIPT|nr:hypothetical protein Bhyg_07150 [Pseudolycoriella hygida]
MQNVNVPSGEPMMYYDDENCTDENYETEDFIKIGNVFNFEKYPKRTFSAKDIPNIKDMELQILIAKFNKSGAFEAHERSTLAKCLIRHILTEDFTRQLQRVEFTIIAKAISEMFHGEDPSTYFIPSQRGVPARGKLYSHPVVSQSYFPFEFPMTTQKTSNSQWLLSTASIENFDINVFTEVDLDAKVITARYKKSGKLDAADRILFCKSLIKFSLSQDFKQIYKKEDFQRIAQLIISVFPTESIDTYFTPAQYGHPAVSQSYFPFNFSSTAQKASNSLWLLSTTAIENFDLKALLDCHKGQMIMDHYDAEKSLSPYIRRNLIALVVDYFVENRIKIGTKDCNILADKIVKLFPSEDKCNYFIAGSGKTNARGGLYIKYNNQIRLYRSKGLIEPTPKRGKLSSEQPTDADTDTFSDNEVTIELKREECDVNNYNV